MTRVAITTVLISCALALGSASQALAASALSTSTDSGSLQYGGSQTKPELQKVRDTAPTGSTESGNVAAAQTSRQLAAGDLPFTGFSALAVLFAGLLLLASGLQLRRRTLVGRDS